MAFNKEKPAGRFASGDKFKGRASAAGNTASDRSSRKYSPDRESRAPNTDRPARGDAGRDRPFREDRTGKFRDEGKKVYNRSERFTRNQDERGPRNDGDRPRFSDDKRPAFKSGPKFNKPAPYKSRERFGAGNDRNRDRENFDRERSGRPERSDRPDRADDRRAERPQYGERRNTAGGYAARGERRSAPARDQKPYAKPDGSRSFGADDRRTDRGGADKPRFDRGSKNDRGRGRENRDTAASGERPESRPRSGSFNRDAAAGPKRPFDRSRSENPRTAEAGDKRAFERSRPREDRFAGKDSKDAGKTFRPRAEEPAEAPNYNLKRYQARDERKSAEKNDDGQIRLNRYIANAGICSRREADTLIAAGEIKVNGEPVTEMGYLVKPGDTVTYGKKRLNREKMVYVLLNKPKDFITTTEDPEGRKTVMDLVASASKERIFPVGRLDRNTTGLLLFTNDGELAQKLTHPSHNISKIYQVELDKPITREHFEMIVNGLELEDGKAEVDDLALIGNTNTTLGIKIHLGRNRIVRRIFEHLGYEVVSLDRVEYAGLTKKDLPRGKWRFLSEKEVIRLKYFI